MPFHYYQSRRGRGRDLCLSLSQSLCARGEARGSLFSLTHYSTVQHLQRETQRRTHKGSLWWWRTELNVQKCGYTSLESMLMIIVATSATSLLYVWVETPSNLLKLLAKAHCVQMEKRTVFDFRARSLSVVAQERSWLLPEKASMLIFLQKTAKNCCAFCSLPAHPTCVALYHCWGFFLLSSK